VFLTDEAWAETLDAAHSALQPGGWLVFDTRDPKRREWRDQTGPHSSLVFVVRSVASTT
jgi:hypothetical protein